MSIIDFAQRLRARTSIIKDSDAAKMKEPPLPPLPAATLPPIPKHESKADPLRTKVQKIWDGTIGPVAEPNQKDVRKAMAGSTANFDVYLDTLQTPDRVKTEKRAVRRSDNHDILSIVGRRYCPLQNSRAFDWFQPLLDKSGAILTNAGAVKGGTKAAILCKLPGEGIEIKPGDVIDCYLKLTNSHDGKSTVKLEFLPMRLLCANGLAAVSGSSILLNARHTSTLGMKLDNISDIIRKITDDYQEVAKTFQGLAAKPIKSEAEFISYAMSVFDVPEDHKAITQCVANFHHGRGASIAGGTWWGAYNAVNEYMQYDSSEDVRVRQESLLFGRNEARNRRALALALAA
jgi:phage/plasmid-like protein (TIGR03299 family)